MAQTTDLQPGVTRPLTEEQRVMAGWVLGTIADKYAAEDPTTPVDLLDFPIRVGATAYTLVGMSCRGGLANVARAARAEAGEVEDGLTRGELALRLRRAAERLGCEWDDNGPMIPRIPIPGPRRSPENPQGVTQ
ncbi:hypothetical protein GR925_25885 [Streptomyces sp. HUCO-GS316]|uniref:hypothetical protein n=1 Tax=Streptomyces sp. HUCO-GS316 TaxID=2692198 RepID=UPI00136A68E0|nr:hypothetical protein [Streptomyces sp. HUCO-GS316]MXM66768.1 hypothetical protein [Streptomyces sp. HUCO-GS316]